MLCSGAESSHAQALNVPAAETCLTANQDLSLRARLPHTAARLKSKEPLKIVAIGSSSTVGLWALRSADTYPEVMRRELSRLTSNARILVINSGRVADTIPGNVARFERDVLSYKPDLVVWQLGTNDVAWGGHPDDQLESTIVQGVHVLKTSGTDVILMDLQYAPMVLRSAYHSKMRGNDKRGCSARTDRPIFEVHTHAQGNWRGRTTKHACVLGRVTQYRRGL